MVVEAEPVPGILGVDHVGIAVADLDDAVAFHVETLGLRELHREENLAMGVVEVMLGAAETHGPGAGSTQIQLLAPLGPQSPITGFLDRSGPGVQHLAYRVRNVENAATLLRSKGLRLLYDSARTGTRGSRINFVHPKDAGGVLIELVESAAADAPSHLLQTSRAATLRAAPDTTYDPSEPGGSRDHPFPPSSR